MVAEFDRRRKVVVEGLNKLPGVSCATPKGAFYAFPNIKQTGWKAKALASSLLEEAGVAIIGGPDFGILGEGYVRLSLRQLDREHSEGARRAWANFSKAARRPREDPPDFVKISFAQPMSGNPRAGALLDAHEAEDHNLERQFGAVPHRSRGKIHQGGAAGCPVSAGNEMP